MPDLILWLCAACGPVALLLYWRDRHARSEMRQMLAAAIAQRDGAEARASDAEDAFVNRYTVSDEQRERESKYPQTILLRPGVKFTEAQKAKIADLTDALPATHPQRRRRK